MKVAVWYNNQDIRIEDVPTPQPGPTEMLVKVVACGICGSDIVEWYRLPRAPLVQGHEIGAEVVEAGKSVKKFKKGDRVFIAPKVPCLRCDYCKNGHFPVCSNVSARLPGGFAEYILVPEPLVEGGTYLLPDTMTYDQSTLIEPLACVVRAQKLAGVQENQAVMVMGCGMSGLLQVKLAKAKRCTVIATDLHHRRLEFAAGIGADILIHAAEDLSERVVAGIGRKADVVILCTAAISAVEQAWACVDKGGAVVFFAVPGPDKDVTVPINHFWTRETKILTSYYCGPPDIVDAIHLIETGAISVDDVITHRLPLSDIAKGFQLVINGEESLKVIIRPHQKPV
jgi:L-iditol 2-dehydrogenase